MSKAKRSVPKVSETAVEFLASPPASMSLGTSRHRMVSLVLSDGIVAGRYQPGEALPGEDALAKMFKVSRVTVRRALLDLEQARLIVRKHGLGTFVADVLPKQSMVPIADTRLPVSIVKAGALDVEVLEFGYCPPPPHVRTLLKITLYGEVQRAVRLRRRGNQPMMHLTTYVPGSIGRTYTRTDLERVPLYKLLARAKKGYQQAEQNVGACLADPALAHSLNVAIGAPLIFIQCVLMTASNEPVEYLEVKASPDLYRVRTTWDVGSTPAGPVDSFMPHETAD